MAINIPIISSLDSKGFDKALTQFKALETNSQRAGFVMQKAFLPAVAALGALSVAAGLSIKAAIEDSAAQAKLAQSLQNVTNATDAQIASVEAQITAMSLATGVADDELRPAFANLVRGTQDLGTANEALSLAMDIAAGTGTDLAGVTDALAKAYGGNLKGLKTLSPEVFKLIKDGASLDEVMGALSKTFGGSAATAANTAEGQFKRLQIQLNEAKESIGMALLPALLEVLPYLTAFGNWAMNNTGIILGIGTAVGALATGIIAFKAAMVIANAVTVVFTALNLSAAAAATAFNVAVTLGVGAAAIAAGLVVAAGAFAIYKNATKTAVETIKPLPSILKDTTTGLDETKTKLGSTGTAAKEMANRIKEASEALKEYLATSLQDAKNELKNATGAFNDFAENVSNSIKDAFSFQDAKDAGDESGKGFLSGLRDQVAGIVKYGQDVKRLLEMGLSTDALQAVLDAGGESGAAIAAELIKGGSTAITETNALVAAANEAALTIGQGAAAQFYGAGVSNAQSYLAGVQAAFDAAQAAMGKKGLTLPQIKGIGATFGDAVRPPSITPVAPVGRPGANFGDPGYVPGGVTVNITGGISTSAEIGQSVVNAIRAYNRAAGPADIQIA